MQPRPHVRSLLDERSEANKAKFECGEAPLLILNLAPEPLWAFASFLCYLPLGLYVKNV